MKKVILMVLIASLFITYIGYAQKKQNPQKIIEKTSEEVLLMDVNYGCGLEVPKFLKDTLPNLYCCGPYYQKKEIREKCLRESIAKVENYCNFMCDIDEYLNPGAIASCVMNLAQSSELPVLAGLVNALSDQVGSLKTEIDSTCGL